MIVIMCDCTDTTRNGPRARMSNLFFVMFAIAFAEFVSAAESSGWFTKTMSLGVSVEETRASFS